MKHSIYFILISHLLICITSCSKENNDSGRRLNIESDKIVCESCNNFGIVFDMNKNEVFVGGDKHLWIFDYSPQGNQLVQEIDLSPYGWLTSITAMDENLYLGIIDDDGTGSVYQYSKIGSEWQYKTRFIIGRSGDNFGDDIAVSEELLVIGASALWDESFSQPNIDPGSFYIYTKEGADWNLHKEFYADNSLPDDWFGNDVLIWNDLILVAGLSTPLHIYSLGNEGWELSGMETEILPLDIANYQDTFLYLTNSYGLQSFKINSDGTFVSIEIDADLDLFNIGFSYDNFSIYKNHALIAGLNHTNQAYLLKLENDLWTLERTFTNEEGGSSQYYNIKLTENHVVLSGYSDGKSFLHFEEY